MIKDHTTKEERIARGKPKDRRWRAMVKEMTLANNLVTPEGFLNLSEYGSRMKVFDAMARVKDHVNREANQENFNTVELVG